MFMSPFTCVEDGHWLKKIIEHFREIHLGQGGDPVLFNSWLKTQGVEMTGLFTQVDDQIMTMIRLKHE
jgi:hypothetical protein